MRSDRAAAYTGRMASSGFYIQVLRPLARRIGIVASVAATLLFVEQASARPDPSPHAAPSSTRTARGETRHPGLWQRLTNPFRSRGTEKGPSLRGPNTGKNPSTAGTGKLTPTEKLPRQLVRRGREPVDLVHGALLEGSVTHGGLQPHYLIDLKDRRLKPLLNKSRKIGQTAKTDWDKIGQVVKTVKRALPNGEYDNPVYLNLLSKYRESGKPIPIGEYLKNRVGVCRENAIATHLALKAAGVESRYLYVKAQQGQDREDHAVVVVKQGGETWVVDSYNSNFNGYRLKDILKPGGIREGDPIAPFADRDAGDAGLKRRFVNIHTYPKVWAPEPEVTQSASGLRSLGAGLR